MPREIDAKKTRKALRKLRRARQNAAQENGSHLSDWETEFVDGVEERLQKFGSAFSDPDKGALSEPLSARQRAIVRQIDRKAQGKPALKRSGFRSKGKPLQRNIRDINDD